MGTRDFRVRRVDVSMQDLTPGFVGEDGAVRQRADVVVIGGGIMGAAALRYLAELGCRRPVLLERETLASGSTGQCAGGVRTLFSDELNVRIGLESIRRLQRFEEELGEELDLRLDGYLFLLDDPADVERFEPDLVVQGCAQRAARLGARVEQSCAVERILVERGRVAGVETARGRIDTDCVVLTAGVWSRELAATAGFDLPVEPERRYMHVTGEAPDFPKRLPLTVDFSTSFYF